MKKLILAIILFPSLAFANPFLVCDPAPANEYDMIDYYVVTGLPSGVDASHIAKDTTKTYGFKFDLANLPAGGPYTVKAKACSTIWGCSADSNPFSFSKPAALTTPSGPKLTQ